MRGPEGLDAIHGAVREGLFLPLVGEPPGWVARADFIASHFPRGLVRFYREGFRDTKNDRFQGRSKEPSQPLFRSISHRQ